MPSAPYKTYFGGKAASGTPQTIINRIPPHKTKVIGCLGNCAITRYMRPATTNILNDLDTHVTGAWANWLRTENPFSGPYNFDSWNLDVSALLQTIILLGYDSEDTFIYIDPPYLLETRRSKAPMYRFQMSINQHREMLELVRTFKHARIMISHYPAPLYDEILFDWNKHDFWNTTQQGQALERIYMNYELTGQLHDYSYIGEDFREREANNRIVRNMMAKIKRLDPQLRNRILQMLQSNTF